MNFFDFFYRWKSFYGVQLYEHMKGYDDALMNYNPDFNQFPSLFLWTIGIVVAVFVLYYYIINSPRLVKWWHWLISMAIVAGLTYWVGFRTVIVDVNNGTVTPSLQSYVGYNSALMFGIYNMMLAMVFYFVFTLLFRRWSRNCKHSPWELLTTKLINRKK